MTTMTYGEIHKQLLDLINVVETFKFMYYQDHKNTAYYAQRVNLKVRKYLRQCESTPCLDESLFYYQYVETLKCLHEAPLALLRIGNQYRLADEFIAPLLKLLRRLTLTERPQEPHLYYVP